MISRALYAMPSYLATSANVADFTEPPPGSTAWPATLPAVWVPWPAWSPGSARLCVLVLGSLTVMYVMILRCSRLMELTGTGCAGSWK